MLRLATVSEATLAAPLSDGSEREGDDVAVAASSRRRNARLTNAERGCFRQFPTPSPHFAENLALWRLGAGEDHSPHVSSIAKPQMLAGTLALQGGHRPGMPHRTIASHRRRESTLQHGGSGRIGSKSSWRAQEEQCAKILRNIYPSTLTGMDQLREMMSKGSAPDDFSKELADDADDCSSTFSMTLPAPIDSRLPSHTLPISMSSPSLTSARPSPTAAANRFRSKSSVSAATPVSTATGRVLSKTAAVVSSPTSRATGRNGSKQRLSKDPIVQLSMKLLRDRPLWNPCNSDLGRTAVRLVQGVAAHRLVRKLGGSVVLIGGDAAAAAAETASNDSIGEEKQALRIKDSKTLRANQDAQEKFSSLYAFRKRLLQKHSSVQVAFNEIDLDQDADMSMREWCSVLNGHDICTLREARVFFDLMDANHDRSISLAEFHNGLEAIAPVNSIEVARKRLLCLGYRSILQGIAAMDGGGEDTTMVPLTFAEFATALRRIWIIEPREHNSIFDLVKDTSDRSERITLSEFAMGLTAASPYFVLEDFLACMTAAKPSGSHLLELCEKLIPLPRGVPQAKFVSNASKHIGVSAADAQQVFNIIDIDRFGWITAQQLHVALKLSGAKLTLEESRLRVLQCYKSIEKAVLDAYNGHEDAKTRSFYESARFDLDEFVGILETIQIHRKDTERLVQLMGITRHGGLTLKEFLKGIKIFAPSYLLHGLKMQLLQVYDCLADAFAHVSERDRRVPLSRSAFGELLNKLKVSCDEEDRLFHVLDIRASGFITISELISALHCVQLGSRKWVAPDERDSKAKECVRQELAPYIRRLAKLKMSFKAGVDDGDGVAQCVDDSKPNNIRNAVAIDTERDRRIQESKQAKILAAFRGNVGIAHKALIPDSARRTTPMGIHSNSMHRSRSVPSYSAQHRRDADGSGLAEGVHPALRPIAARRTFQKVTSTLQALGPERSAEPIDRIGGYFVANHEILTNHAPVLQEPLKRSWVHRS